MNRAKVPAPRTLWNQRPFANEQGCWRLVGALGLDPPKRWEFPSFLLHHRQGLRAKPLKAKPQGVSSAIGQAK